MNSIIVMNIGMFDKDTKRQELSDVEFVKTISKYMDCTVTLTTGVYTHNDGTRVIEPSVKVDIYNKSYNECCDIAKQLCKELNQECIVVNELTIDKCEFIGE